METIFYKTRRVQTWSICGYKECRIKRRWVFLYSLYTKEKMTENRCSCGVFGTIESKDNRWFCDLCASMMDMRYFNWRKSD